MMLSWMLLAFAGVVLFFHVSEPLFVWIYNRGALSFASLLLSWPYFAMLVFTISEFEIERRWIPSLKHWSISAVGIALCVSGEAVRKSAMVTASRAFTHQIATTRQTHHDLVTRGIYQFSRHPGYLGWFWWAIGAQLVLANPVAATFAAVIAWRFFKGRIVTEEALLHAWFGELYETYRSRTPTRIPFIA